MTDKQVRVMPARGLCPTAVWGWVSLWCGVSWALWGVEQLWSPPTTLQGQPLPPVPRSKMTPD